MGKITRTFSIESDMFSKFEDICKNKELNKSKVLQDCIKSFVIDNFEIKNKSFQLKDDDSYEPVTILSKEDNMFHLSDGNILNIVTFEKIYEEIDSFVLETKDYIETLNKIEIQKKSGTLKDVLSDEEFEKMKKNHEKLVEKLQYDQSAPDIDSVNSDDFLKCNLPLKEVERFVDNFDSENVNNILSESDAYLQKLKEEIKEIDDIIYEIDDVKKDDIIKFLSSCDKKYNIYDLTDIFSLNLTIIGNSLSLFVYYRNEINKEKITKLLVELIKDSMFTNIYINKYEDIKTNQHTIALNSEGNFIKDRDMYLYISNVEKYLSAYFNSEIGLLRSFTEEEDDYIMIVKCENTKLYGSLHFHYMLEYYKFDKIMFYNSELISEQNNYISDDDTVDPNEFLKCNMKPVFEDFSEIIKDVKIDNLFSEEDKNKIIISMKENKIIKIKKQLKTLKNDDYINLTRIISIDNIKIIKNKNTLFVYYLSYIFSNNYTVLLDFKSLEKLLLDLTEDLNIEKIHYFKYENDFQRTKNMKLDFAPKFDNNGATIIDDDIINKLTKYISEKFETECQITSLVPTEYFINIEPCVILNSELNSLLESFGIKHFTLIPIEKEKTINNINEIKALNPDVASAPLEDDDIIKWTNSKKERVLDVASEPLKDEFIKSRLEK